MSDATNNEQRLAALFGLARSFGDSPRGKLVAHLMWLRAHRAWVTVGSYAWFRFTDDIGAAQKRLASLREHSA